MQITKSSFVIFFLFQILLSCSTQKVDFAPQSFLNTSEDSIFRYSIIRYAGKLAPKATHKIKFDPSFDEYYINLAHSHKLDYYYPSEDGFIYFQLSRIAPSLHERYVGIGGKLKRADDGEIIHYEELYRTWKMPKDELMTISLNLFTDMVNGKSLEKYYTKNTPDDVFIIEFPDDETYFDVQNRRWVSTREDVLSQFEQERHQLYEKRFTESTLREDSL